MALRPQPRVAPCAEDFAGLRACWPGLFCWPWPLPLGPLAADDGGLRIQASGAMVCGHVVSGLLLEDNGTAAATDAWTAQAEAARL